MIYMQTASGIEFDLVRPTAKMVNFDDMAEHLAKIARFAGATPGVFYSVGEHCCRASDAILAKTDNPILAAYALLHDGHEAYIVDRITPERGAEQEIAREYFGAVGRAAVQRTPNILRYRIDEAIHDAAEIAFPLSNDQQIAIKLIDLVMLRTEKRDLMAQSRDWPIIASIDPLPDTINPWDWQTAKLGFLRRARALLPCFTHQSSVIEERTDAVTPLMNQNKAGASA